MSSPSGSASPSAGTPSAAPSGNDGGGKAVEGLQRALAAEQQAAFGYALIGPHVPTAHTTAVRAAQTVHEALRDRVAGLIADAGGTPDAPLGDYPSLYPLLGRPLGLAARLEDGCAAGWRFAYATAASTDARRLPQQQLTASAVRATRWRIVSGAAQAVTAFPGI